MTEVTKAPESAEAKSEDNRVIFLALVSFDIPQAGTTQIYARDVEHARELLTEAHKGMKSFVIHDIFDEKKYSELQSRITNNEKEISVSADAKVH